MCTINPLILSSKCANIDPRRPYHSTLPSTVGPQRQYQNCGGLLFQVSSLNHHIILNFVIFSSFYDGCKLHPSGKAVTPECFREDDYKNEKKISIYTPKGDTSETRQKVPRAPLNQQDYISALFCLSRLLDLLFVSSGLNLTRAISFFAVVLIVQ